MAASCAAAEVSPAVRAWPLNSESNRRVSCCICCSICHRCIELGFVLARDERRAASSLWSSRSSRVLLFGGSFTIVCEPVLPMGVRGAVTGDAHRLGAGIENRVGVTGVGVAGTDGDETVERRRAVAGYAADARTFAAAELAP